LRCLEGSCHDSLVSFSPEKKIKSARAVRSTAIGVAGLPIYKVNISFGGKFLKRTSPVTPYTIKGLLRSAAKQFLLKQGVKSTMVPVGSSSAIIFRLFEVSPFCPPRTKLMGALEPIISMFGIMAVNYQPQLGLSPAQYELLLNLGKTRIRIITRKYEENVVNVKQGVLSDINTLATTNPHDLVLRHITAEFEVLLLPSPFDHLSLKAKWIPKGCCNTIHEAHVNIFRGALAMLSNPMTLSYIDSLGGRSIHTISVKVGEIAKVGEIETRDELPDGTNVQQVYKSLVPEDIDKCHQQLLQQRQFQAQAKRGISW